MAVRTAGERIWRRDKAPRAPDCHARRSDEAGESAVKRARNDSCATLAFLALTLLITACAGAAPPSAPQDLSAAMQPKRGGVLHLPVTGTNASLNPYIASGSPATLPDTIYEKLLARDAQPGVNWAEHQKLMPWLAERWERTDPNTYVFQLRKDVTWHDGKPLTAADVTHTFNHLKEARTLTVAARVRNIRSIEVADPHTVRLITTTPNPDFLTEDVLYIGISPKHLQEEGKQLETSALGTGPFKLKNFDKTAGWTVARNEAYRMKDLPYLDGVAGHYISDRGTITAGVVAGNLDVMNVGDKPQLDTALGIKSELTFEKFYGNNGYGIFLAMDKPPFDDIRVRQAMNLAIDRQDMITKGAFGDGIPNPPGFAGWVKSRAIPQEELVKLPGYNPATRQQDIARAKQLLGESGHRNIQAKMSFSADATNARPIAEVGAAQLKELLGFDITLQPLDRATLGKVEQEGTYELHVHSFGRGRNDFLQGLHSKGTLNKRGPYDPDLDAVVEKYVAEFDDAEAGRLARQLQKALYDKAYFIGAIERAIYTVYQPWVHDFMNNYGGNPIPYWTPPAIWLDVDMLPAAWRAERP